MTTTADYLLTPAGRQELLHVYHDGMLEDVLRFWFPRSVDVEHGGFFSCLERDGRISVPSKGNLWKSFFHLPRMQWYCRQLLEEISMDRG